MKTLKRYVEIGEDNTYKEHHSKLCKLPDGNRNKKYFEFEKLRGGVVEMITHSHKRK